VDSDPLQREFERSGALRDLLMRCLRALIAHTGQIAVCNRHDAVHQ
jgi:hypothetical protein